MSYSSSFHKLENVKKLSMHVRRQGKIPGYRLSYLITCTCFVNVRELAYVSSFFSLHTLITIRSLHVWREKRCCLRALLSDYLLLFWLERKQSRSCISDQYSKREKNVRSSHYYVFFTSFR